MTNEKSEHIHISEKLAAYARGELDADTVEQIRAHIADCDECRAELRALNALAAPIDPPLSEIERGRLHDAVTRRTQPTTGRQPRWGGIAAALGAAAVIALGVVLAGHGGSSSDLSGGGGSAVHAPAERSLATNDQVESGNASGGKAAGPPPTPLFERDTALTMSALRSRGAASPVFRAFATYFDSSNASRFRPALVKELAAQAPTSDVSSQIEHCAHSVLTGEQHPALPAYAAETTFEDQPALVLGFAWTPATVGPLDHYMFWAWPRRECGVPLTYETGQVRP